MLLHLPPVTCLTNTIQHHSFILLVAFWPDSRDDALSKFKKSHGILTPTFGNHVPAFKPAFKKEGPDGHLRLSFNFRGDRAMGNPDAEPSPNWPAASTGGVATQRIGDNDASNDASKSGNALPQLGPNATFMEKLRRFKDAHGIQMPTINALPGISPQLKKEDGHVRVSFNFKNGPSSVDVPMKELTTEHAKEIEMYKGYLSTSGFVPAQQFQGQVAAATAASSREGNQRKIEEDSLRISTSLDNLDSLKVTSEAESNMV